MNQLNFASLFKASPNPYLVLSPTFIILGANEAYLRVTGRTLADIVERSIFDAFPSDDAANSAILRASLDRVVRTGLRDELPLIRYGIVRDTPNGKEMKDVFWSATHTPLFDEMGELKHVLQHTEDVTELQTLRSLSKVDELAGSMVEHGRPDVSNRLLQRAESVQQRNQALSVESSQLRRLFAQAPGFIGVVRGSNHVFELANESFCRMVGRDAIVGRTVREVAPEVEGQGLFEVMDAVYATGEPRLLQNHTVRLLRNTSQTLEELFVNIIYQPLFEEDRSVSGIFIQGTDITDQRRAEIELTRHRDELEQLVTERSEALRRSNAENLSMQAALLQSQKMEALGKLTGGVAHDFNNALQVIAGNLHLLKRGLTEDDAKQRRVSAALAGVERGAKLASHLLAFARKQPLQPVVLNVGRLLRELDDMLRRALGETIELETVVAGGVWNTMVDRNFLENALLNLVINARDAINGQGQLTIEAGNASLDDAYAAAHAEVTSGQYVMIAVSDTGCGMSEEIVQKAFEPFFTTKPEGKGTGLGLSMVYGFVKQSGGHLKVYSEPGHGTTVRLYLPRSFEVELVAEQLPLSPAIGGTETILVVEDDAQVRETVVELLSELGYKVLKAPDASSALAVVESGIPIDLLFTDVVMPGTLRSPELARRAKLVQPQIEVLFTSGYTENAIVHGGRLDPGVSLLSKPYPREELARKVQHILSNRKHADGLQKEVLQFKEENLATDRESRNRASLRVLVVEDNAAALESTLELIEYLGHRPAGYASAEAALQAMKEMSFDVLMTDLNLPGLSGHALAEQSLALNPGLRIVFASGMQQPLTTIHDALWLAKPFSSEDIASVLQAISRALDDVRT